jgi:pentatricopeptide repeat protein
LVIFSVFDELNGPQSKWKIPRSVSSYTALIVACSKNDLVEKAFEIMFQMISDKTISMDQRSLNKFVVHVLRRHNIVSVRDRTAWDSTAAGNKTVHPSQLAEFEDELHRWQQTHKIRQAAIAAKKLAADAAATANANATATASASTSTVVNATV